MNKVKLCKVDDLPKKDPTHYQINGMDLVAVRDELMVSVLYGRCLHKGALMANRHIEDHNLICGVCGLKNYGHHGPSEAMGVDRNSLPKWDSCLLNWPAARY